VRQPRGTAGDSRRPGSKPNRFYQLVWVRVPGCNFGEAIEHQEDGIGARGGNLTPADVYFGRDL
jgi:hypothetical protein